jgi:hypothetical protein
VTTTVGNSTCSANIPSERWKRTHPNAENLTRFLVLGSILWFDPRREHSSVPTAKSGSRRAQGLSRLAAPSRPPEGLGLDWPEHGGILKRIGLEAAAICASTAHVGHSRPPVVPTPAKTAAAHLHQECWRGARQEIQTDGFKGNSRRW